MVRQSGLQADVAGTVNALGQLQRIDSPLRILLGEAVEAPADAPNLATGHGPLEQGIQARTPVPNPESSLISGEDASLRLFEGDLGGRLHVRHTVT